MLLNGSGHLQNVIQWHLNSFFFQKITKNRPTAESFAPRPLSLRRLGVPPPDSPSVIPLSYTSFLNTFPKLNICVFEQQFKPSPFAKSWLRANRQRFQIFHPTMSLSHKNFLFGKILMTSFHVICGLGLPST